ncbi:hypothetical protein [Paraburkholderia aromaticivorans]|uniref:Uncharacterized protein n=1 Tax=Paraburkholderia aromaticivorans TaxID=2026199 RepID=A0A248VKN2_9BURK|nr:hypothetical protein [Paraburkholderia aromaticivorans]ASV99091.1 hypothetical protein CJU94_13580 [Paraburkholderia aromaticivorans]
MPHQYRILEKIAFSMVVLSAFVCSVFIAYERCPELRFAMQVEQDILACNSGHMPICSGMDSGLLAGALTY